MRTHSLRLALVAALAVGIGAACGNDSGGGGGSGLIDTWVASAQDAGTEFVFDNNAGTTFDVVADGGGVVTMALNTNGTYSLTVTVSSIVVLSSTGTYTVDSTAHTVTIAETGGNPLTLDYILAGNSLQAASQNLGDVTWDFDNNSMTPEEPAFLYATFARH